MKRTLNQYFTPSWAAELLVRRHFADLCANDTVLEPSCGDGRFLMAIPRNVGAYGVEIDPMQAEAAIQNTGREVIVGDFLTAKLPRKPTVVIGNPPFQSNLIDDFLARCYNELDYGGRIGFLLPVYYLQTASKVVDLNRRFSIVQELVPRNLFEGAMKPLMFCRFTKERHTVLSGFFLYAETDAVLVGLKGDIRDLVLGNKGTAHCWRDAVELALRALGGRATLNQLYLAIENNRPTNNPWWREQVRKICGIHHVRVGAGEYALNEELMAA